MRGAFVACFGNPDDPGALERIAEKHRWHRGIAEYHAAHGLHAAVLADSGDGPTFEVGRDRVRLVHGAPASDLAELQRAGERFAAVECDGRELWATRDPLGLCPLFYRVSGGALWLSTEIAPLVALGGTTPDLSALSSHVALVPQESCTGWTGIFRVLPGCSLRVTTDLRIESRRYWKPQDLIGTYRDDSEHAQAELRAHLLAAVDRCANGQSGILLSGGLDSTAVAAAAAEGGHADRLVHVTFDGFRDADEKRYAQATADAIGRKLDLVPGDLSLWDPARDLDGSVVPYLTPPQLTADAGLARLAELGARVALDGNDGDGVLGYVGREWGELVLTRRFARLRDLAATYGGRRVLFGVADDLLPPALWLRALRGRPPRDLTYLQRTERYFAPQLWRRMREADLSRWRSPFGDWRARQLRQVMPVTTMRMEEHELRAARFGLDMRHPFADRRLVEFLISLPAAIKSDPFEPKALLRRAVSGMVPDEVIRRPEKAPYFDVVEQRVDPARCLALIKTSGARLPLVDYNAVFEDAARGDGPPLFLLMQLARAHAFTAAA